MKIRKICILCKIYQWFMVVVGGGVYDWNSWLWSHAYFMIMRYNQICKIYLIFKFDFQFKKHDIY